MNIVNDLQPLFSYVKSSVFDVLPSHLCYHNLEHTENVMKNGLIISAHAGLNDHDSRMLYAAAILHDTGYGKKYAANEGVAAILAAKLLPDYGFDAADIKLIESMILATNLVITPTDKLEIYLIDADMGYLGQDDYLKWSHKLRLEWEAHERFNGSDQEWIEGQIAFLSQFQFNSQEAIALFELGKQKNIERLKGLDSWPF